MIALRQGELFRWPGGCAWAHGRWGMRRLVFAVLMGSFALGNTGCWLNIWSADPVQRSRQLLNVSEDLRNVRQEWDRIWFVDQPSHLTPYRTHGGIL